MYKIMESLNNLYFIKVLGQLFTKFSVEPSGEAEFSSNDHDQLIKIAVMPNIY